MRLTSMLASLSTFVFAIQVPCLAQSSMSFQGYTGILNTPNALTLPDGMVDLSYNNQVDGQFRDAREKTGNYIVNFGMFPSLEGGIRLYQISSVFPRVDHVSMTAKVQVPFLPEWAPKIAFGIQDYGGSGFTDYFRTKYAVMSEQLGPLRLSLGDGRGPKRMKGVFYGAEWTVRPWLELLGENDTVDHNVGARLLTPPGFLPAGMSMGLVAKSSLDFRPHLINLGITLRVPLGGRAPSPMASHASQAHPSPTVGPDSSQAPGRILSPAGPALHPPMTKANNAPPANRSYFAALARDLAELGFENVRVGTRGTTLVVEYENNVFNHNELDGLGLVMGSAVCSAPPDFDNLLVSLRKQDIGIVQLAAPMGALRDFFQRLDAPADTLAERLSVTKTESFRGPADVAWAGDSVNPTTFHSSVRIGPGLSTAIGTEVGSLNYRLALTPDLQTILFPGTVLDVRWDIPVAWTEPYANGDFKSRQGTTYTLQRVWLSQALPLAPGLMAQLGVGNYDETIVGRMADVMWSPGSGTNRFTYKSGLFTDEGATVSHVSMGAYRYYHPSLETYVEVTAGRFYGADKGYRVDLTRYFRDTTLSVFYTHTNVQTVGFTVSLPLTPRHDLRPGWLQIRGNERFKYGLGTVVRNPDGRNPILPNEATVPATSVTLERSFYNGDRLSENYIKHHLPRLREAFQLFRSIPHK